MKKYYTSKQHYMNMATESLTKPVQKIDLHEDKKAKYVKRYITELSRLMITTECQIARRKAFSVSQTIDRERNISMTVRKVPNGLLFSVVENYEVHNGRLLANGKSYTASGSEVTLKRALRAYVERS